jgi:hypothetical protein
MGLMSLKAILILCPGWEAGHNCISRGHFSSGGWKMIPRGKWDTTFFSGQHLKLHEDISYSMYPE